MKPNENFMSTPLLPCRHTKPGLEVVPHYPRLTLPSPLAGCTGPQLRPCHHWALESLPGYSACCSLKSVSKLLMEWTNEPTCYYALEPCRFSAPKCKLPKRWQLTRALWSVSNLAQNISGANNSSHIRKPGAQTLQEKKRHIHLHRVGLTHGKSTNTQTV